MNNPLAGRRVVVTRFEMEDGPLATSLRLAGAEPVVSPLIGINPVADDLSAVHVALRTFDWIAFTSANAARMFWARIDDRERAALRTHRGVAAVGPATARALAAHGATASVTAPEFIAESLADALGDVRGKRVLWPHAAGARSVFADILCERGADVIERILYDTVELSVPEEARATILGADAITFTSPSAVRAFVGCFGTDVRPAIICIGPVTAAAATNAGLNVTRVAAVFTLAGLVSAVSESFARVEQPAQSSRA